MDLQTTLQLLQTASVILAMAVAVGTLRGRGDDKTEKLTKMQSDIEYIKKTVDCIPQQGTLLTQLETKLTYLERQMNDHLALYHGPKKEENS